MNQNYRKDDEEQLELHRKNLRSWKTEMEEIFEQNDYDKLVDFIEKRKYRA